MTIHFSFAALIQDEISIFFLLESIYQIFYYIEQQHFLFLNVRQKLFNFKHKRSNNNNKFINTIISVRLKWDAFRVFKIPRI